MGASLVGCRTSPPMCVWDWLATCLLSTPGFHATPLQHTVPFEDQQRPRSKAKCLPPLWSGAVPSVAGIAPHAKGILLEFVQPQGD